MGRSAAEGLTCTRRVGPSVVQVIEGDAGFIYGAGA